MSPIELLKSGILNGDWPLVCEAFRSLTGESLKPPIQALAAKELAGVLRGTVHMAVDQVFDEWVGGPTPKGQEAKPMIVVPTPETVTSVLGEVLLGDIPEAMQATGTTRDDANDDAEEDRLKPEDIDGEGPTEVLRDAGRSGKENCFGDQMRFVSRQVDVKEVQRNRRKAESAARRKQTRPEPPTYEVECTGCNRKFQSLTKPSKYVGQKCGRCIRSMDKPDKD